jgi:hypothetical protein
LAWTVSGCDPLSPGENLVDQIVGPGSLLGHGVDGVLEDRALGAGHNETLVGEVKVRRS